MERPTGSLAGFDWDQADAGRLLLAGVDEAGRGCWAGPVVAAAVILPTGWCPEGLDDSKKLTSRRRDNLFEKIRTSALSWGACAVSAAEIDQRNILQATLLAMARSLARLTPRPELVLVDGLQVPDFDVESQPLVKGDSTSAAIAAASVIAKVARDRIMIAWDHHYPGYGFASHKGYGAAVHRKALHELGPCPLHRRSYRPVAEVGQGTLWNESG